MLPEDEFIEDEYFGEAYDENVEHENSFLKEILVVSATENDMLELFFGRVRNKDLPDNNLQNMYKDEETQFYLVEPDQLDEIEVYQEDNKVLPSWFIYDWKYIKIKKNENGSPNPSLPIGELKLIPVPEGMCLRFEAIYGSTNFDLKRFIKNIIDKIKQAKEIKVSDAKVSEDTPAPSSQKKPEQKGLEPWKQIKESQKKQRILELWWEEFENSDIGNRLHPRFNP